MTVLRRRVGGNWYNIAGAVRVPRPPGRPAFTGAVTPSSGSAIVAWSAPLTAGSPVTGYVVTATPGGATASVGAGARTATIAGLNNGTPYTFTVRATSAAGDSPLSPAAGPVIPTAEALVKRTPQNTGPLGVFDATLGRNLTYGDLTPHAGSLTLNTPGATYTRVLFTAPPVIAAHNVTLSQCLIQSGSSALYAISWGFVGGVEPTGLHIIDTEVDGQGTDGDGGDGPSAGIKPGINFTATRSRFRRTNDGLKPQNNPAGGSILIEDCLIHEHSFPTGSHSDCLQIAGAGAHDVTVRRTTFDGYRGDLVPVKWASSSLMQWGSYPKNANGDNVGALLNILIEDCYVDGGAYGSRLGVFTAATCQNVKIRRVQFGLNHRYGAFSGTPVPNTPNAPDGGFVEVESCTWEVTGTTHFGRAVTAGESVI